MSDTRNLLTMGNEHPATMMMMMANARSTIQLVVSVRDDGDQDDQHIAMRGQCSEPLSRPLQPLIDDRYQLAEELLRQFGVVQDLRREIL